MPKQRRLNWAGPLPRRWIALAAVLVAGSLFGQAPPTQAAPAGAAGVAVYLYAERVGGARTICVGDKVTIRVRVLKRIGTEGAYSLGYLLGVNVGAFVDGSGIGSVAPSSGSTRMDGNPIGAVYFTFTAQRTGATTVVFRGTLNTSVILGLVLDSTTVVTALPFTVEDCKYRVNSYSRWQDPSGRFNIFAVIKDAGLAEVGGGLYQGTASVEWIIVAGQIEDCIPQSASGFNTAEMSGQVYGPDTLLVDIDFRPASITLPIYCVGSSGEIATGTHTYDLTSEAFQFDASHGGAGAGRRDHPLYVDGGRVIGPFIPWVTRVTGQ